jgi:hypothetical protein
MLGNVNANCRVHKIAWSNFGRLQGGPQDDPQGRGSQIPVQVWHSINQIRATYSFEYSANQVTPTPLISKAGIIAHHKDDAEAIFKEKIKFVYDQLDPAIKQHVSATTDRAGKIVFSNGRVSG